MARRALTPTVRLRTDGGLSGRYYHCTRQAGGRGWLHGNTELNLGQL